MNSCSWQAKDNAETRMSEQLSWAFKLTLLVSLLSLVSLQSFHSRVPGILLKTFIHFAA